MATAHTKALFVSAARTASANGSSYSVKNRKTAGFYLIVGTVTGSNPTLDVVIQESADGSNWFAIATFAQVTSSTKTEEIRSVNLHGTNIRAVATIGGTTPSFTFNVDCCVRS